MDTKGIAQMFVDSSIADAGPMWEKDQREMHTEIMVALIKDSDDLPTGAMDEWTEDEVDLMVMGDDDGQVPEKKIKDWPHLHEVLNKYLT